MKEVVRELHVSRNTVRKALRANETAIDDERSVQPVVVLGASVSELDGLLAFSQVRPAKGRLTPTQSSRELRGLGCDCGYDAVSWYARGSQREQTSATAYVFVSLSFAPTEAYQFDGSPWVVPIGGTTVRGKAPHVRLRHSRRTFVRA